MFNVITNYRATMALPRDSASIRKLEQRRDSLPRFLIPHQMSTRIVATQII